MSKKKYRFELVKAYVDKLKGQGYKKASDLLDLQETTYEELVDNDGSKVQVNTHAFYDDKKLRTIRVVIEFYDMDRSIRWWHSLFGVESPSHSEDYIVAPDGSFTKSEPKKSD